MITSNYFQQSLGDAVFAAKASLVELDLSDNAFGPDGINAVKSLLSSRSGYTIRILKLNNNGLGPNGGKVTYMTKKFS